MAVLGVLVVLAMAGLLISWTPLTSQFQQTDVYFAGVATMETAGESQPRSGGEGGKILLSGEEAEDTTIGLRFHRSGLLVNRIAVFVQRETRTLTGWRLNDQLESKKYSMADRIFSSKVRNAETRCRILLTVVSRGPGGQPSGIEFSQLEWLSGVDSIVAGAVDNSLLSEALFPYAVLIGKLTSFREIGFLAIPIILQLAAYAVVVRSAMTSQWATAEARAILFLHCIAVVCVECPSIFLER